MILNSIRWRIQFWHGLFLFLLIGGFLSVVYQLQYRLHLERIDSKLQETVRFALPRVGRLGGFGENGPGENRLRPDRPRPAPPLSSGGRSKLFGGLLRVTFEEGNEVGFEDEALFLIAWGVKGDVVLKTRTVPEFARQPFERTDDHAVKMDGHLTRFHQMPRGPKVQAGYNLSQIAAEMRGFGWKLAAGGLGSGLLIVWLGHYFIGRSLRAIDRTRMAAERIAQGKFGERIAVDEMESELGAMAQFLNKTFDRLESAYRQQVRFTADASHEMRTSVAVILAKAQLALRAERSPEDYRQALKSCVTSARHMAGLIESLQTLAQYDSGALMLEKEPSDLAVVAEAVMSLVEFSASDKRIRLVRSLEPCPCACDVKQMRQAVLNILSNAVNYSRASDTVEVITRRSGEWRVLEVRDTGPGIPAEHLPYLFDRFYRVDSSRKSGERRSGLGLSISRAIVEAHGGRLLAESELGKGSCLRVELPA